MQVVLRSIRITGPPPSVAPFTEGIMVYTDNSVSGIPVIDGLLMSNVQVLNVAFGISCGSGPCHHWWMDNVRIACRPTGSEDSGTGGPCVSAICCRCSRVLLVFVVQATQSYWRRRLRHR